MGREIVLLVKLKGRKQGDQERWQWRRAVTESGEEAVVGEDGDTLGSGLSSPGDCECGHLSIAAFVAWVC